MTNRDLRGGGKIPGKTEHSGKRRSTTRRSGFKAHSDTSGGEYKKIAVPATSLEPGEELRLRFKINAPPNGEWVGYSAWYNVEGNAELSIVGTKHRFTQSDHRNGTWNKLGSIWKSESQEKLVIEAVFRALQPSKISIYEPGCGPIHHQHLENEANARLLNNMHLFSPEANFYINPTKHLPGSDVRWDSEPVALILKSCNRCARFLPINVPDERAILSFTNHCVAAHRIPCKHNGFGLLKNDDLPDLSLLHGFQLECRFCKKFEVNGAHNPIRTTAQMREDGARRRSMEVLLDALYAGSPQLNFKQTGKELYDYIWEKFSGRCFKCDAKFKSTSELQLDHTRPLKLLWPLDDTATALCRDCNTRKRDRPPVDFYTPEELVSLSKLTGIALDQLRDPSPNMAALNELLGRLPWFFDIFLQREDMRVLRDGKMTGGLVVKALQKVIAAAPLASGAMRDIEAEYSQRTYIPSIRKVSEDS